MGKVLYITEKPSVAMEFAKALKINGQKRDGFLESNEAIIVWCIGHLVTMSYPEKYDISLKRWSLKTLPFLPEKFKYEVIPGVKKQFNVVKQQIKRPDVSTIYVCTDSGREGEYIYRLVDEMIGIKGKEKKRVWINSQTEDEIRRGVREARPLAEYDNLGKSAYLRAKEDYLAGINFSRLLTLIYSRSVGSEIGEKKVVIAVGRVMSCVLGMVVDREREIRNFVKTFFYRIESSFLYENGFEYQGEWKAVEGSGYYLSNKLFNEKGFKEKKDAELLISELKSNNTWEKAVIEDISKQEEKKSPPLLFNLAELQNECSKLFKISPDQTLGIVQNLYERKMLTYPRTDARVLSKAVAAGIEENLKGLTFFNGNEEVRTAAKTVLENKWSKGLVKSKYVNDSKITDHYAIIPTGQGLENYSKIKELDKKVYELVAKRFLAVFYPPAVFKKITITTKIGIEKFFTSNKVCISLGYLEVLKSNINEEKENIKNMSMELLDKLKKGTEVQVKGIEVKEGETSPPKPYTSGSIILAMENAGKLIEDEELREQIKGSGIGTSATRAEIIKKLERLEYIRVEKKSQVLSPTRLGELIVEVIKNSIKDLLNPELTASWEKGLEMVANDKLDGNAYLEKLNKYIKDQVLGVLKNSDLSVVKGISEKIPKQELEKNITVIEKESMGTCPLCGKGEIIKNSKGYGCSLWKDGCKFYVSAQICGKKISESQVKKIIKNGKTELIKGFRSKKNTTFSARLVHNNGKIEFSFENN